MAWMSFARHFLLLVVISSTAHAGMAPSDRRMRKNPHGKNLKALIKYYKEDVMHDDRQHTQSDAMELYSVGAKKVLWVTEKEGNHSSYNFDPIYKLVVTNKKGFKQNKFVTETVSFQNLRIKSQDNNQYLCVKNGNEIGFKAERKGPMKLRSSKRMRTPAATNKKNKPRKRCQFTWDFTDSMHIQLSITLPKSKPLFLTVKDGVVLLTRKRESTEIQRSFIWVPTKNAGNDDNDVDSHSKKRRKLSKQNYFSRETSQRQRSFDNSQKKSNLPQIGAMMSGPMTQDSCPDLMSQLLRKTSEVKLLRREIRKLKRQLKE